MAKMNYSRFHKNNYKRDKDSLKSYLRGADSKIIPRSVTGKQQVLIERMLKLDSLNNWQKDFLGNCIKLKHFSFKQKSVLNNIYTQTLKQ